MKETKKLFVFDLDGVLINSKLNMLYSWKKTCEKFSLKIPFKEYFKLIGIPFEKILDNFLIKKKRKIKCFYNMQSKKKIHLIKTYEGVNDVLKKIKENGHEVAIITSKDKNRTNLILKKKIKILFSKVLSPVNGKKWKPHAYPMRLLTKNLNFKKKNIYYVGDTSVDRKFAKNSGVKFIYTKYGYGDLNISGIKKFRDIERFI